MHFYPTQECDLEKVLDEVEQRLTKSKRKVVCTRGVNDKGVKFLDFEVYGEKFHLEIDDFREYIRMYRETYNSMFKYEHMVSSRSANEICFKVGIW